MKKWLSFVLIVLVLLLIPSAYLAHRHYSNEDSIERVHGYKYLQSNRDMLLFHIKESLGKSTEIRTDDSWGMLFMIRADVNSEDLITIINKYELPTRNEGTFKFYCYTEDINSLPFSLERREGKIVVNGEEYDVISHITEMNCAYIIEATSSSGKFININGIRTKNGILHIVGIAAFPPP
jgi:hypothetical protein